MSDSDMLYELQEIRKHMERLDKRDRLRTIGSTIKGLMSLLSFGLLVYSLWYFYNHGQEVIENIASTAASEASKFTKDLIIPSMQGEGEGEGQLDMQSIINNAVEQFRRQQESSQSSAEAQGQ